MWQVNSDAFTGFASGNPAWTAVQVPDLLISGITVKTAMIAESISMVTVDRSVGGSEQDCQITYRVNGGAWVALKSPVHNLIASATENFTTNMTLATVSLTPGNTYDFRTTFSCGIVGTITVRARQMTVKTFLAG